MSEFAGLYDIRDAKPEDKNFVLATFLRGLYHGDSWFSLIPRQVFMENYHKAAEALVSSSKTAVKIACLKEDPDVIIGCSILSSDYQTIHWVYVKDSKQADGSTWRRHGVARSLLPKYPKSCTHLTKLGKSLMHKFEGMIFNPFDIGA